jgi:hypothetical protein
MPSKIMDTSSEMIVGIIQLVLKVNPTLLLAFRNPPEKIFSCDALPGTVHRALFVLIVS